jgi:hypothetical protein
MSKRLWIALGTLAFVFFVVSLVLFFNARKQSGLQKTETTPEETQEKRTGGETRKVKLFFFTEESDRMIPAVGEIMIPEIREEVYRRFLELLLKRDGPRITPVPEGIDVQGVFFLAAPGMLILDFNENLINLFPVGTEAELQFVYFFVNNVCYNFKEIKKVKFMAGGNEIKTISGHIDMEQPFYPDNSYLQDE